mmetsp:Transcript_41078/g.87511  ORF Transcript_41078/g.87511 Transcript_41078/m.87511 type:complete len:87 (-) Transcript_41078:172-432(-)
MAELYNAHEMCACNHCWKAYKKSLASENDVIVLFRPHRPQPPLSHERQSKFCRSAAESPYKRKDAAHRQEGVHANKMKITHCGLEL